MKEKEGEVLNRVKRFYPPKKTSLVRLIKKRISNESLMAIAKADYTDAFELHLEKILAILAQGHLSGQLEWHPLEVLRLTRWSEIEFNKYDNLGFEQRHLARLLVCTLLLLAEEMPENAGYGYGDSDSLIQWIDSSVKLGGSVISPSMEFLLWKIEVNQNTEDRHYLLFGLLILLVEFGNIAMVDAEQFIQLLEDSETALRSTEPAGSSSFLFVTGKGQRFDKWIEYAGRARDALNDPWFEMLVETMNED